MITDQEAQIKILWITIGTLLALPAIAAVIRLIFP
jgi:hypothetical protein